MADCTRSRPHRHTTHTLVCNMERRYAVQRSFVWVLALPEDMHANWAPVQLGHPWVYRDGNAGGVATRNEARHVVAEKQAIYEVPTYVHMYEYVASIYSQARPPTRHDSNVELRSTDT